MVSNFKELNWLNVQGKRLAAGEPAELTEERWLELYQQVKDELDGPRAVAFASHEARIRSKLANLSKGNAA